MKVEVMYSCFTLKHAFCMVGENLLSCSFYQINVNYSPVFNFNKNYTINFKTPDSKQIAEASKRVLLLKYL